MPVTRCHKCDEYMEWLVVIGGKRLPFDHPPYDIDELPEDERWLIGPAHVRGRVRAVAKPWGLCRPAERANARRVLAVHPCPPSEVSARRSYTPTTPPPVVTRRMPGDRAP